MSRMVYTLISWSIGYNDRVYFDLHLRTCQCLLARPGKGERKMHAGRNVSQTSLLLQPLCRAAAHS